MILRHDLTVEDDNHLMIVIEMAVKDYYDKSTQLPINGRWKAVASQLKKEYDSIQGELVLVKTGLAISKKDWGGHKAHQFALTFRK